MSDQRLAHGTAEHYQDVALYDLEYADRVQDIRWYRRVVRRVIARGDRLVELGAGSGRVTCPLARSGFSVVALDRMPEMLDALRERIAGKVIATRIEPLVGDMRAIPLPDASVELVIAPFNALLHLYTWRELLDCFEEVARVLRPGGTFVFDVLQPDLAWLTNDPKKRHGITRFTHPTTGQRLVWSTNHRYDATTQVCHIKIYYDKAPPRGTPFVPPRRSVRRVALTQRMIFPQEVRTLVHAAGLSLVSHTADFSSSPLTTDATAQCVICRRA